MTALSPRTWALLPIAAALWGCKTMPPLGEMAQMASTMAPQSQSPLQSPMQLPATMSAPDPALQAELTMLFRKETVTGADLINELQRVRLASSTRNSSEAAGRMLSGFAQPGSAGSANMATEMAARMAFAQLETELKKHVMSMAFSQLQSYLTMLAGDQGLQAETIKLPSSRGLNQTQMKRAVTLAAMVVATRVSGRMLKQAQQNLSTLDVEYKELITRREKAAELLQAALSGPLPAGVFTEAEATQLRDLSRRLGVAEFAKDMGAQNLALRLVRARDRQAFDDYSAKAEGLTKRQQAALQTVTGVAAFGALLSIFSAEMVKLGREQPREWIVLAPLIAGFVAEVPDVLSAAYGVTTQGFTALVGNTRSFRVTVNGQTQEVLGANDVFDAMAKNGALAELQRALFRDANRGLLQSVNFCDPTTAAQMLDAAVPAGQRSAFARELSLPDTDGFSFVNAFGPGATQGQGAGIAEELLGKDHRPRLADRRAPMAQLQYTVAGGAPGVEAKPGFLRWNTDQLLRLLFVNRDGSAAQYAAMEINGVIVRPVPSMQSLYAYETLANACRTRFTPAVEPPRATETSARPAPRPGTRPPPAQKPTSPAAPAGKP